MKKAISLLIILVMISVICISAGITAAALAGDTDGDGEVNNKDVVTLFRFVSGTANADDGSVYDFNNDGEINNKDVVALFRFVSSGDAAGETADKVSEAEAETDTDALTEETTQEILDTETDAITETEEESGTATEEDSEEITESQPEETFEEFVITPDSTAELSASRVIADHMVIQRDQEIKIWGFSNKEGAKIRGLFMDSEARGEVKDGKWEIVFPAKEATADPQTLTVDDSCGNTLTFTDILVGDVWVLGGQSNAKATVSMIKASITIEKNMPMRIFMQDETDVWDNRTSSANPCDDVINQKRRWKTISKSSVSGFSALGWFIGSRLVEETGIPQGVVCMAAGAASMSELMPKETADMFGYTKGIYVNASEHYNGLMHPFLNMKFKAMVFFQGEAEGGTNSNPSSSTYARDFEALMTELRNRWGFDFPVYNVQISDYPGEECETNWTHVGEVRSQQYDAYKKMTGIRLIPSYDIGSKSTDPDGAHSPYKKALADRIVDLALADLYNKGSEDDALAPEPDEINVISSTDEEKVIEIKFKNAGSGLVSLSGTDAVSGFVYGNTVHPYGAGSTTVNGTIVSNDTVRVTVSAGCKYIGYACTQRTMEKDVPTAQLYNSNDLPALAFYLKIK